VAPFSWSELIMREVKTVLIAGAVDVLVIAGRRAATLGPDNES
jgi:hypothetical protein